MITVSSKKWNDWTGIEPNLDFRLFFQPDGESWDWIRIITLDKWSVIATGRKLYNRIRFESIFTFSLWLQISFSLCTKCNLVLIATACTIFYFNLQPLTGNKMQIMNKIDSLRGTFKILLSLNPQLRNLFCQTSDEWHWLIKMSSRVLLGPKSPSLSESLNSQMSHSHSVPHPASVGKGGLWSDDCRAAGAQGNPCPVPAEGEEIGLSGAGAHSHGQRTEEPHLWTHQSQERRCHWS